MRENIYAFIDQQNLHIELKRLGWEVDYARFRKYLKEKYLVERAYVFIGYIKGRETIYEMLNDAGFECIFKPTYRTPAGIKGNCDAEMVLHTHRLFNSYTKAIIVSGDGDFACLVEYLIFHNKLRALMIPNRDKYSSFLKKFRTESVYINDLEKRIKKTPLRTKP